MSLLAHRIRRLTWLVRTPSESSAFAQRQMLRAELESVLLPTLERVFDEYSSSDEVLHIPKLMLHVGAEYRTTADLARRIEEQMQLVLSELIAAPDVARGMSHNTSPDFQPTILQSSVSEHRRDLLIEYLRSGRISWRAGSRETPALVDWLRAEAEQLITALPRGEGVVSGALETRIAVGFRLWQLLSPATRDRCLQAVSLPREEIIAKLIQAASSAELRDYWQLRVAAILFALREEDLPVLRERSLVEVFAEWSLPLAAGSTPTAPVARNDNSRQAPVAGRRVAEDNLKPAAPLRTAANRQPEVAEKSPASDSIVDDLAWRVRPIEPTAASDVPGLLASDAGLILLHPFLPRLFEATGIAIANGRSLAAECLPRAAALLNWIGAERDTVFEFELSLSKVLLGLTADTPIAVAEGLLSETDRDEADALLTAVIQHWSALGQISVAGLRTSFLQRRGMLREDDQGWRLRMETESFDMLLGQLPWSFNVVKLPWMIKPIFTDWPTP